jgi:NitT/TauT family transport system substrate-binding protein
LERKVVIFESRSSVLVVALTKLRVKNSYIPWSFLDIVAKDDGIFPERGLDVEFFSIAKTSAEPADKVSWYSKMVKDGSLDAYSVCAWGAIDRLEETKREKIMAASSSSGYAFSIVVAPGLGIKTAKDLAEVPIAVNMRTGSHYCVLSDLERVLPYDRIKVVHGGEPQSRLRGLIDGKFQAVALISPYTEIAVNLGFVKVAETKTVDVLAFVARDDIPMEVLSSYLASLNEAARRLNANPEKYRGLYVRTLRETFQGYPFGLKEKVNKIIDKIESTVPITTWGELQEYPKESFDALSFWMNKHNLLQSKVQYENMVFQKPIEEIQKT